METENKPAVTDIQGSKGAEIWEALKDPQTWASLKGLAEITGHTVAATRIPMYGLIFSVLAGLFGAHPHTATTPEQKPTGQDESVG